MSTQETDSYHTHSDSEPKPQQAHAATASPKALGITLILMVLGVLAVIFVLVVYFDNYMDNYKSEINETSALTAPTWEEKQAKLAELGTYGWVDSDTARQPLEAAMEQVINEYASN